MIYILPGKRKDGEQQAVAQMVATVVMRTNIVKIIPRICQPTPNLLIIGNRNINHIQNGLDQCFCQLTFLTLFCFIFLGFYFLFLFD